VVETENPGNVIEGLRLVFVELPKFTPHTFTEKRMQALWLRYLTEIDENTRDVSEELLANADIKKAVEQLEESAFSPAQMEAYDKFWDIVRTEKTYIESAERKGLMRGRAEGRAEIRKIATNLKSMGIPTEQIVQATGLTAEEIAAL